MNARIYILPKLLSRKYSFLEKLSVWVCGEIYKDNNKIKFKPYALFSKFNEYGYTTINPYITYINEKWILLSDERKYYESSGFIFKSEQAKQYYKLNNINNILKFRKN